MSVIPCCNTCYFALSHAIQHVQLLAIITHNLLQQVQTWPVHFEIGTLIL